MEDPISEIPTAINLCAGAKDADCQIDAFHQYFTRNAEFLHPLCFVPSRPNSRDHVIGIYLFYRIAIPETSFEITSVAFDKDNGKLFVDLYQMPYVRVVSWVTNGWRPVVPMHIHFWLRREYGKWKIYKQEDTIQPMSFLLAFPPFAPWGKLFYWMCEIMGLMNAVVWTVLGVWQPKKHFKEIVRKL